MRRHRRSRWFRAHSIAPRTDHRLRSYPRRIDVSPATPRTRRALLSGSLWVLLGRLGTRTAVVGTGVVLARLLTKDELGTFFLATSIVTIVAAVARLGMETASVRLVAEALSRDDRGRARSVVLQSFAVAAAGAALAVAVLGAGGWNWLSTRVFGSSLLATTKWAALGLLAALAAQVTIASWFRALGDMRVVALFDELLATLLWLAALAVVWHGSETASATTALAARAAALVVSAVGVALLVRRRFPRGPARDRLAVTTVVGSGAALMVTGVVAALVGTTSDLVILGAYRPAGEVASYGVAVSVSALVAMPFAAATVPLAPMIAGLWSDGDRGRLRDVIRGSTAPLTLLTALIAAAVMSLGRPLLAVVFGVQYRTATNLLLVLCAAQVAFVATGPCGLVLIMCGRNRAAAVFATLAAVCSVGADIWAAPRHGALGVAFATSAVLAIDNVATVLYVRRTIGIWTTPRFAPADLQRFRELVRTTLISR